MGKQPRSRLILVEEKLCSSTMGGELGLHAR
jgi:hypothetical protein